MWKEKTKSKDFRSQKEEKIKARSSQEEKALTIHGLALIFALLVAGSAGCLLFSSPTPPAGGGEEPSRDLIQAHARFCLAVIEELSDQPDLALAEYRRVLQLDPSSFEATFKTAVLLLSQSKPKESISWFKKAGLLQPNSYRVHFLLATAYYKDKQIEPAIAEYRAALKIDPHQLSPYLLLAGIFSQQDKHREALASTVKASRNSPTRPISTSAAA